MARKIALTGAAGGIGGATVALLEAEGNEVIALDRVNAPILADLATVEGRRAAVAAVEEACGGTLDGLICCAGTAALMAATLSINYFGTIELIEGLRHCLARSAAPRVVVVSSAAVLFPQDDPISHPLSQDAGMIELLLKGDEAAVLAAAPSLAPGRYYACTKVAVTEWLRAKAVLPEWGGAGIVMNAVAPGSIDTPLTQLIRSEEGDRIARHLIPRPMGRVAQPEEVAHLFSFLTDARNSYVTGQMIYIDGGAEALRRGPGNW